MSRWHTIKQSNRANALHLEGHRNGVREAQQLQTVGEERSELGEDLGHEVPEQADVGREVSHLEHEQVRGIDEAPIGLGACREEQQIRQHEHEQTNQCASARCSLLTVSVLNPIEFDWIRLEHELEDTLNRLRD